MKFTRAFSINREISKELDRIYLKLKEKDVFFIRDNIGINLESMSSLVEFFIYSGLKHIKKIIEIY